jgi:hypothetical protein
MSVEIAVSIQQGCTASIQNYLNRNPAAVASAMRVVAERVLETSEILVPVRTGFLKSTLGYRQDTNLQVTFYATAPYAAYVEYGTSRISARLFLTRAIQQHEAEFPQEVLSALAQLRDDFFSP